MRQKWRERLAALVKNSLGDPAHHGSGTGGDVRLGTLIVAKIRVE